MKDKCLDIGIIQAFLDGELSQDETSRVSSHMALCDTCSIALAEAESEATFVFSALDRELDTLVPTQRLWNKINDSIAEEKAQMPWWEKAWALVSVGLMNPSVAVAASLVIVVGVFAAVWMNRGQVNVEFPSNEIVASNPNSSTTSPSPSKNITVSDVPDTVVSADAPRIERAAFKAEPRRMTVAPAVVRTSSTSFADPLAGESSYVSTISTLSKTVEDKKDGVLRPSQRVAFERDMAMVDDSIAKMRKEVKRNPKNETARQVLYSSYQNKIDL
ncbi:MAG: zf-HC2 domain-containing protein, partial [Pyrinomonadaceae bacterium]